VKQITDVLTDTEASELIEGMPFREYLQIEALSSGCVVNGDIKRGGSMKKLRSQHEKGLTKKKKEAGWDAIRNGAAIDHLIFNCGVPEIRRGGTMSEAVSKFNDDYAVWDGGRRYGKAWNEFKEMFGLEYVQPAEHPDVLSAAIEVLTDSVAAQYWTAGVSQPTLRMTEFGMLFRGRPDWVTDECIVDLKTTRAGVDDRAISRTTYNLGYHYKLAMYRRWWKRATGQEKRGVLIFVEQDDPWDVVVVPVPDVVLSLAEEQALKIIQQLRGCMDSGVWPGHACGQEKPLEIPSWEMEDVEWQE
jgi:hypothetical protein